MYGMVSAQTDIARVVDKMVHCYNVPVVTDAHLVVCQKMASSLSKE